MRILGFNGTRRAWIVAVEGVLVSAGIALLSFAGCSTGDSSSGGGGGGTTCSTGEITCSGACVDTSKDPANCGACGTACPAGQVCSKGACGESCATGTTACGQSCTNLQTDNQNCGACGTACQSGQACVSGKCAVECGGGTTLCTGDGGSFCVDTKIDVNNCGKCGSACTAGFLCVAGACKNACPASEKLCTPEGGGAYCANTKTDNANCGNCGKVCSQGLVCSGGNCGSACGANETLCTPDGGAPYCANTGTDDTNCGTCGHTCGIGQACSGGQCTTNCGGTETLCTPEGGAAYCADTNNSNTDCGSCGIACAAGQVCQGGVCRNGCVSADGGTETLCTPDGGSAYCADTNNSNTDCGACGVVCGVAQECQQGKCVNACASQDGGTLTLCTPDGGTPYCADTNNDPSNCGACGTACQAGNVCVGGNCTPLGAFLAHNIEDGSGTAYMVALSTNNIYKVTGSCSVSLLSGSDPGSGFSLAFNPTNATLYAVGQASGNVYSVNTSNGAFTLWKSQGNLGNWIDGMWFDPSGNMYINDSATTSVLKITPGGTVTTFYSGLSANYTQGTCDSSGNLYVPNRSVAQVSEISSGGTLLKTLTTSCPPWGIVWTNSNTLLYTCDTSTVYQLNLGTLSNTTFATPGGSSLNALSVDQSGNVWVGQWVASTFYKLNSSGTTICSGTISGGLGAGF